MPFSLKKRLSVLYSVFPKNHLPHDCPICNPISSLEGMTREFWNFRVSRPHYAQYQSESSSCKEFVEKSSLFDSYEFYKSVSELDTGMAPVAKGHVA